MLSKTATDLIAIARQKADAETPTPDVDFETNDEVLGYLNESYNELVDLIIASDGVDLLVTSTTLTSPSFTLPARFYRDIALAKVVNNVEFALPRFVMRERSRYTDVQFPAWRIMSGVLKLYPLTAAPGDLLFWYIPHASAIGDGDTVSTFGGWDVFLTSTMAVKMLAKEDRTSAILAQERRDAADRVRTACADLSAGIADRVADIYRTPEERYNFWDDGDWPERFGRP